MNLQRRKMAQRASRPERLRKGKEIRMRKTILPILGLSILAAGAVTSGCFGGGTPLDLPPVVEDPEEPPQKTPLDTSSPSRWAMRKG